MYKPIKRFHIIEDFYLTVDVVVARSTDTSQRTDLTCKIETPKGEIAFSVRTVDSCNISIYVTSYDTRAYSKDFIESLCFDSVGKYLKHSVLGTLDCTERLKAKLQEVFNLNNSNEIRTRVKQILAQSL